MALKINSAIFLMVLLVLVAVCCVAPAAVNPALCTPANGRCSAANSNCCVSFYCRANNSDSADGICLFCGAGITLSLCLNNGAAHYAAANRDDNNGNATTAVIIALIILIILAAAFCVCTATK